MTQNFQQDTEGWFSVTRAFFFLIFPDLFPPIPPRCFVNKTSLRKVCSIFAIWLEKGYVFGARTRETLRHASSQRCGYYVFAPPKGLRGSAVEA